jgi:hypothetical protein
MQWPKGAKKVGLFDPSRPQTNGCPGLLRPDGSSMHAIVPSLSIDILKEIEGDDKNCELWAFVWYGSAARRLSFRCNAFQIPYFLSLWQVCPEYFLVSHMGWEPLAAVAKEVTHFSAGAPLAGVRVLSLDDVEF